MSVVNTEWTNPDASVQFTKHDGHHMPISISTFLVRSGGKTALVDTGIGAKDRSSFANGRLPEAIAEAGVRLDQVDIVLATHIHVDHAGWHTTERNGAFLPTFPTATHVFNRSEFEYWTAAAVGNTAQLLHVERWTNSPGAARSWRITSRVERCSEARRCRPSRRKMA